MSAQTAEWMTTEANAWIAYNPEVWEYMKTKARQYAQHHVHFSMSAICEVVRYEFMTMGNVDGYKVNNSLRAAFARRLIREVPECEPYIHTRHSKLDVA